MKTNHPRSHTSGVLVGLLIISMMASSCQPLGLIDAFPDDGDCSEIPVPAQPTVRDLAADLDSLERQIERYGSVVAQQPLPALARGQFCECFRADSYLGRLQTPCTRGMLRARLSCELRL